jgi:hypothetical protein
MGKSPQHPLNGKLSGPQGQSTHFGENKNLSSVPEIEQEFLSCPTLSVVTTLTELTRLTPVFIHVTLNNASTRII